MAPSRTETLDEAAHAVVPTSEWERDRKAWNLPRALVRTIARAADKDQPGTGESDSGGRPTQLAASPETTE